ncbi:DUF1707 domain-containing protein [Kribbella sp. NBC_00709]|uniref:DUF1707 SHOCT-like domain-containing protein n=1 Tax=Kribbella sp. NBC_00709 TaxID=2975972 RepID=UPI002E2BD5C9|nr:DUF1707 domain-containing protein [Kribbella sp. NBC_00709]
MIPPEQGRRPRSARRGREWQGWDGPGWGGQWRGPGWVGDWRETGSDDPRDAGWNRAADAGPRRRIDVPVKRVRIGDAERDQAVSLLSEHFVAGRLTQAEFEERSEQATRSRYNDDLEPLFDDLPTSTEVQVAQTGWPARSPRRPGPPPAILMLMPFLMMGLVISSIALAAPWLLWGVFWVVLISGMSRRRWHNYRR